jgi:photosystem II stability/assembly factor-like uncharacterized protein
VLIVTLCVLPKHTEALTWGNATQSPASAAIFNAVATDQTNSTFIAVDDGGAIYISNDYGATFTRQVNLATASALNDVVYNATVGVAIAVRENGEIWTSNNLIPGQDLGGGWSNTLTGTNTQALNAVTFDGSKAIAVGDKEMMSMTATIFYNNDGLASANWTQVPTQYEIAKRETVLQSSGW